MRLRNRRGYVTVTSAVLRRPARCRTADYYVIMEITATVLSQYCTTACGAFTETV